MMQFQGERALLVGGSCEMALSLARALCESGVTPVLTCRSQRSRKAAEHALEDLGGAVEFAHFDLAQAHSPDGFSDLNRLFSSSSPDYLVDFSHGNLESLVASAKGEDVGAYFTENITGRSALISWAAMKMMKKKFGRMVYLSSTAAALPIGGQGFYAASKQASEALYRSIGIEMGKKGITSVVVRPGYVDSGRATNFLNDNAAWVKKRIPLGRAVNIPELTETLMFLLSDGSRAINATTITIDGGLSACK